MAQRRVPEKGGRYAPVGMISPPSERLPLPQRRSSMAEGRLYCSIGEGWAARLRYCCPLLIARGVDCFSGSALAAH